MTRRVLMWAALAAGFAAFIGFVSAMAHATGKVERIRDAFVFECVTEGRSADDCTWLWNHRQYGSRDNGMG